MVSKALLESHHKDQIELVLEALKMKEEETVMRIGMSADVLVTVLTVEYIKNFGKVAAEAAVFTVEEVVVMEDQEEVDPVI